MGIIYFTGEAARAANSACERLSARAHQTADLFDSSNAAAGAQRGAIQGSHGVWKTRARRASAFPAKQHSRTPRGTRRLRRWCRYNPPRSPASRSTCPGHAPSAPCDPRVIGGHFHTVLLLQGLERAKTGRCGRSRRWEFGAGHQVIHVGQDAVEAVVDGIDIHRDGDCRAGARWRRRAPPPRLS